VVYAKKVKTTDPRFGSRNIEIRSGDYNKTIPVPNSCVLCNACNRNIYPNAGYLIYLGKRELDKDQPYDFYCRNCTKEYFPKAKEV